VLGVVENMSFLTLPDGARLDVFGQGGGGALAQEAAVDFLRAIPLDPDVRAVGDVGVPVVVSHPNSAVSRALSEIARGIARRAARSASRRRWADRDDRLSKLDCAGEGLGYFFGDAPCPPGSCPERDSPSMTIPLHPGQDLG